MAHTPDVHLPPLDRDALTTPVRRSLGRPAAEVIRWDDTPILTGSGAATNALHRLAGTARDGSETIHWSLILKVTGMVGADNALNAASADPGHVLYWRREALVYTSGLLDNLPDNIRAARCYGTTAGNAEVWLWLEDVPDAYSHAWPLGRYMAAAHALGRFNGAYLVESGDRRLPHFDYLTTPHSLRGMLNGFAWTQDMIAQRALWDAPAVRNAFPTPVAERLLRMWAQRSVLLDAIEALPITLCHKDAWRQNMFYTTHDPAAPLVLIDWAYVGLDGLGTDPGDLLGASYSLFGVEPNDIAALETAIYEGYIGGLRAAGWHGDPAAVRRAYLMHAALKYAGLALWLAAADNPSQRTAWERHAARPFDEFLRQQAALVYYLLDEVESLWE